jgi:Nuclear transport factor 2 (NTF2) domain
MPLVHHMQVGNQFVTQYYTVLHKQPHFLHRFYTDDSTMTYSEAGSTEALVFNSQKVGGGPLAYAWALPVACRMPCLNRRTYFLYPLCLSSALECMSTPLALLFCRKSTRRSCRSATRMRSRRSTL